ncbi:sulfotransferase family 2 domain-containing protein [uncultured Roseobacter sp.]|uniref:sulfotransferase family 2 domain-containing protein n=1 Tax=uncultured Roseobacter sp. TaxID=114847 RepID=UPI002617CC24|nr:sulfotransferase family 2 domain-containing protein [uncultured Roseobacter sp.]
MLVSHKHKFIFLKTRKTAGTSIEMALARFCGEQDILSPINSESDEKKKEVAYPGAKNYRIPLNKMSKREALAIPLRGWPRFYGHSTAEYVAEHLPKHVWNNYYKFSFERNPYDRFVSQFHWNSRFKDWNGMKNYITQTTSYRRSNWEVYTINDQPAVDYMGHYETMHEDLERIGEILGLPEKLNLPQTKSGIRPKNSHYRDVLDDELRRLISIACAKEIAFFGYGFETSEPTIRHKIAWDRAA